MVLVLIIAIWFENWRGGGVRSPLRTDLYRGIWAPTVHISFFAGSKTPSVLGFTTLALCDAVCSHGFLHVRVQIAGGRQTNPSGSSLAF